MTKHTVKKVDDEEYVYRGIPFYVIPRLRGYGDHYQTKFKLNGARANAPTRKKLLAIIDFELNKD